MGKRERKSDSTRSDIVELDRWIERDLTAAAEAGELGPAFCADDALHQVHDILRAPSRFPVLVGPPGVGKTAVVHEIVRQSVAGSGPACLRGRRVVQISLRGIAGRYAKKEEAAQAAQRVVEHLIEEAPDVVPFIRDLHAAFSLDWEPILYRLVSQMSRPMLAESTPAELDALTEYWPDLNEFLSPVVLDEPALPRVDAILDAWCDWRAGRGEPAIEPQGRRAAVELTGRFMGNQRFPRKALDLLRQASDVSAGPVSRREVVQRFSQLTRVPARLVDPDVALDLDDLHSFLADRLLGQQEAVDAMVRMIALVKAGVADLRRPFGVFLFVGPTGVGKTLTAQLLAEYLFGDPQRVIRVNMADFAGEHAQAMLFGAPDAPRVSQQRGVLTQRLAGHPFGVLLLDELEKAHPRVHDAFLQLVDEGRFINGRAEVISVTSLIVIATSNAGSEVYRDKGLGFARATDLALLDQELDRRLRDTFRLEFLNRFDRVVHFHPLDRGVIRGIARRELGALADREGLAGRGITIEVAPEVEDWLAARGYHPHYGARFLRREIERHVTGAVAEHLVRHRPDPGSTLRVEITGGEVCVVNRQPARDAAR